MSDIELLFIMLLVFMCMIFIGVYELHCIGNALCNIDYDLAQFNMMQAIRNHRTIEIVEHVPTSDELE